MIELNGISKTFRIRKRGSSMRETFRSLIKPDYTEIKALQKVSFQVAEGEIVGYIGPNGAGKSTTIKIMCGILTPDDNGGTCVINGYTPWKERTRYVRSIGVVFGQRSQLWWDVPVIDSFDLLKDIYKLGAKQYQDTKASLTEILDLGEILKTPVRQLSLGQRMRCEIAASLLHEPSILFLDEPTIGLDAVSKLSVRQLIRDVNNAKNVTVILTTHDMHDIEALTNRIILIGKGQVLHDGKLDYITENYMPDGTEGSTALESAVANMYKEMGI